MLNSKENLDFLGAVIANFNNLLLIGIFVARVFKYPKIEYWLGALFILTVLPLILMFVKAFSFDRDVLYLVQLILMISFILLELFLDYIFKIDFRQNRMIVIPYLTLFYASFGGMIGIASQAGKPWSITTIITFLIMTATSLIMHFKTDT
ncbi:MAG: hypothetical protein JEY94_04755 [Melioribacteraceae bacterium]|nr:hypothetical protein [Melioribacteraceae bacterium]